MNPFKHNSITLMQYIFLIHGAQVSMMLFSLPRRVAEFAGTDGWISIVLNWLIVCISGWLMLLTLRKYPTLTLPELLERLFGKWLGKLLLLVPIGYFAFVGWFILVTTASFIKSWFLPKTPGYVILFLLAVPGYMLVRYGPRIHGRFSELVFYMAIGLLMVPIIPLDQGHWLHLLPVLKEGWMPIANGAMHTVDVFTGIGIVFLYYPYLQKKQYAVHGLLIANTITCFIYLVVTIVCFVYFSPDGIASLSQPLLTLMKNVGFRFLERMDSITLAAYLPVAITALTPAIYSASFTISSLLGKKDHREIAACYFAAVIAIRFIVKPTWQLTQQWRNLINTMDLVLLLVVPIVLFIYVWGMNKVRKRRPG